MRVVWITDIHLDHATERSVLGFLTRVRDLEPQVVLVGGDIGEAPSWGDFLELIQDRVQCPVRYVLGNHDYYRGSIKSVQAQAQRHQRGDLIWLPGADPMELTEMTALIGEGGWGDGTHGDPQGAMGINDHRMIQELIQRPQLGDLVQFLRDLGKVSADRLQRKLVMAIRQGYRRILVLTHVPPWRCSAWHEGRPSEARALPWFCWGQGGAVIDALAAQHRNVHFTVLSGHTHSPGVALLGPNVTAITGGARYQRPEAQPPMEIQ